MDLSFSPDEIAFQMEVRDFIATHLASDIKKAWSLTASFLAEPDVSGPWHRALATKGWVAPLWPKEHGGPGWTPAQQYIFETECARAGAPLLAPLGVRMVGPVLIGFGSAAQKNYYLPRILSGEDYWCQGYSEPGAGSDLASLTTRAVRDGNHYIINGSKIWTTHAHHANRMFALVRTGQGKRKQEGISFLLIDMTSPGITVRPIRTMGGDHDVNQVFFDNVRVPAANLVGEEGKGWSYGKYLLEFERGAGIAAARLRASLDRLRGIAARMIDDPLLQARFTEIDIDIDTIEMTELRILSSLQAGQNPGPVASMLWLRVTEIKQAVARLGVDILGADALPAEPRRPLYALNHTPVIDQDLLPITPQYLNGRAETIFGGTSEVQREIIGKIILGL
jgi:acyl-CoA dehydrogenase